MLTRIIQQIITYGVFIPGMAMVVIPILKWGKFGEKKTWYISIITTVLICIAGGIFEGVTLRYVPSMVILAPCLLLCFFFFDLSKPRLLYIFMSAIASLSFGGLLYEIVAARVNQDSRGQFSIPGTVVQYVISWLFFFLYYAIRKRITWLMEQPSYERLWKFLWIIPTIITLNNVIIIPEDYSNVNRGKIFPGYLLVSFVILFLFASFQVMLYIYTYDIVKKIQLEADVSILETQVNIQERRSDEFRKDQERLRQQRHDLRHQYAVLLNYLNNEELDKATDYLNELIENIPTNSLPDYCPNSTINAILSYYALKASGMDIDISIKIDLPEHELKIKDSHLCIIFGNLLDNAINSCQKVTGPAFIRLYARHDNNMLYITMDNSSPAGAVAAFINRRPNSNAKHGIGLYSVDSIATFYGGGTSFTPNKDVFESSVWVKMY